MAMGGAVGVSPPGNCPLGWDWWLTQGLSPLLEGNPHAGPSAGSEEPRGLPYLCVSQRVPVPPGHLLSLCSLGYRTQMSGTLCAQVPAGSGSFLLTVNAPAAVLGFVGGCPGSKSPTEPALPTPL